MRRLLRWTFNALGAASLLLCLATAGLWVRSYWVGDQLYVHRLEASEYGKKYNRQHYRCLISSDRGQFVCGFAWNEHPEESPTPPWEFHFWRDHRRSLKGTPGAVPGTTDDIPAPVAPGTINDLRAQAALISSVIDNFDPEHYAYYGRSWAVPHWSLVSAFAVLPAIFALRKVRAARRRRHRSRLGLCPACGYDLRASPERCPECGRERGRAVRSQKSTVSEGVLGPRPSDL